MDVAITDEQLMLEYAGGDYRAFETLYGRHKAPLLRFFRRQTGSSPVAEELLQEVFLRIIHARQNYQPTAPFKVYLWRLARNLLIDHYRRRQRALPESYQQAEPDSVAADERVAPDIGAEQSRQLQRLMTLVGELPCAQREAFLLKEEAGFTLAEIAALTGVSGDTVKSRLRYAISKLRAAMEER